MLGRAKATGYVGYHNEALALLAEIVAINARVAPGEIHYWRAWNLMALGDLQEAWAAIEEATKVWRNSEVAKLAGLIAYRRGELDIAYDRFGDAWKIDPTDCEVLFNIAQIDAEQRRWSGAAATLPAADRCLENTRQAMQAEIAELRATPTTVPERQARQIANRENRMTVAARMLEVVWFNTALAGLNLSQPEQARRYAERLLAHPQMGDRAREVLARLPPQ